MKNIMLILATGIFLLFGTKLMAQNFSITNSKTEYDKEQRAAVYVKTEPDTKDVKSAWKDYMKDRYDAKIDGFGFMSNKDVLKAENVNIVTISDKPIDLYAKIVGGEYGTDIYYYVELADGTYLSPDKTAKQYQAMEFVVYDFLGIYLPNHYAGQIEKSQKVVSGLMSTKEDLSKDITKNSEDIEKMKKEIEDLTKENEKKTKELSSTKEKLTTAETDLTTKKEKVAAIKAAISRGNQ